MKLYSCSRQQREATRFRRANKSSAIPSYCHWRQILNTILANHHEQASRSKLPSRPRDGPIGRLSQGKKISMVDAYDSRYQLIAKELMHGMASYGMAWLDIFDSLLLDSSGKNHRRPWTKGMAALHGCLCDDLLGILATWCRKQEAVGRKIIWTADILCLGPTIANGSRSRIPHEAKEALGARGKDYAGCSRLEGWTIAVPWWSVDTCSYCGCG